MAARRSDKNKSRIVKLAIHREGWPFIARASARAGAKKSRGSVQ
jgi:hypothetical protein